MSFLAQWAAVSHRIIPEFGSSFRSSGLGYAFINPPTHLMTCGTTLITTLLFEGLKDS